MSGFVCIHGHFYQPPRENPWTGHVERQPSAAPHHDWNARITDECYRPNLAARLGDDGRTVDNYARIAFNFGPSLLAWLERNAADVYHGILRADRVGRERNGGHGPAIAQAYGHPILPLCDGRDRTTSVAWGLADFRHRFRREADGIWLPETAVDTPTLETLAAAGVRYCILAPHQGRVPGSDERPDSGRAWRVDLPSGRSLAAFFYDGDLAQRVAFGDLVRDGVALGRALIERAAGGRLAHLAVDGETFGHHHTFGEMALARALDEVERADVTAVNYARFLELAPPSEPVEIVERTSWSCSHGIERWRADCGCASEYREGWRQHWRAPLREALDALRAELDGIYTSRLGESLGDPWALRDGYHARRIVGDAVAVDRWLDERAGSRLDADRRAEVLRLLEMSRLAFLTGTSCAWFFEDVARIEPVQILRYADRALGYAAEWDDGRIADRFRSRLESVPSNDPDVGHAGRLWDREVRTARRSPERVAAWTSLRLSLDPGRGGLPWAETFEARVHTSTRVERRGARRTAGTVRLDHRHDRSSMFATFCWIEDGPDGLFGGLLRPELDDPFPLLAPRLGSLDGPRLATFLDPLLGPRFRDPGALGEEEAAAWRERRAARG